MSMCRTRRIYCTYEHYCSRRASSSSMLLVWIRSAEKCSILFLCMYACTYMLCMIPASIYFVLFIFSRNFYLFFLFQHSLSAGSSHIFFPLIFLFAFFNRSTLLEHAIATVTCPLRHYPIDTVSWNIVGFQVIFYSSVSLTNWYL